MFGLEDSALFLRILQLVWAQKCQDRLFAWQRCRNVVGMNKLACGGTFALRAFEVRICLMHARGPAWVSVV